jgi:hypothetical protein
MRIHAPEVNGLCYFDEALKEPSIDHSSSYMGPRHRRIHLVGGNVRHPIVWGS